MNGKTVYKFHLVARANNPIMRDHRVHDICIMPGVTLLDMTYRLGKKALGHSTFRLNNVLFQQPIATHETFDQTLRVTIEMQSANEGWVQVQSQKVKARQALEQGWSDIMNCGLSLQATQTQELLRATFDIPGFIETASRQWDMDQSYEAARAVDIWHGPFMKTWGTVYQKQNERLVALHLGELAEDYRDKFYAHPAFLDGATLVGFPEGRNGVDLVDDDVPYIPPS